MRITHKHDVKNYLANRRIAVIQKAHKPTHLLLQLANNHLIDKKILEWNDEINNNMYDPYSIESITATIAGYNQVATQADLQRILKHSLVTRNPTTEVDAIKVINKVSDTLTKVEAERIVKNLDYVENVLTNADVNIQKYEALIDKLSPATSRKEVVERCIVKGEPLPANRRQSLLERALERGENYKGRQYSYKELNQLSRDLERYKTNRLDYETAILENKQAFSEGYEPVNQEKVWIWSTLEKTRHQGMDGETVGLTEKFEVVNEVNGDIDFMLYPNDIFNDHNNCSNTCNCQCSYEIIKG